MTLLKYFRKKPDIPRPTWHGALQDAFQRQSAFGLLIDYQRCYHSNSTKQAFENGAVIAQALHSNSIRSIWAMWPGNNPANENDRPVGIPYADIKGTEHDEFCTAIPAPLEAVFTKYSQNLLSNQRALNFVRAQDAPVFIAGGVHAHACLGTSVIEIANEIECDIIIAQDASNFPSMYDALAFLRCHSAWDHKSPPKGRIHISSTAEILENLPG